MIATDSELSVGVASPVKRTYRRALPWGGDRAMPLGLGCLALVLGEAALRLRSAVSAVAIQEHGMPLEGLCAAVMRPRGMVL